MEVGGRAGCCWMSWSQEGSPLEGGRSFGWKWLELWSGGGGCGQPCVVWHYSKDALFDSKQVGNTLVNISHTVPSLCAVVYISRQELGNQQRMCLTPR